MRHWLWVQQLRFRRWLLTRAPFINRPYLLGRAEGRRTAFTDTALLVWNHAHCVGNPRRHHWQKRLAKRIQRLEDRG